MRKQQPTSTIVFRQIQSIIKCGKHGVIWFIISGNRKEIYEMLNNS